MSDLIQVERDDHVATVVFNRPAMRNAISLAMWGEIASVTNELAADDTVRAIVYRGAGTPGLRLRRRHLGVPGEPQGHRHRARVQRDDRGRLHRHPRLPQAHRGHGLRLLHGRGDGGGDGVRSALRRGGLEVRHPRRPAQHHLRPRPRPSARRPGRAGVRQGHPLLGAHPRRPRGASASASSSASCPPPTSSSTPTTTCASSPPTRRCPSAAPRPRSRPSSTGITEAHREKLRAQGIETFKSARLQGRHPRVPREARAPLPGPVGAAGSPCASPSSPPRRSTRGRAAGRSSASRG